MTARRGSGIRRTRTRTFAGGALLGVAGLAWWMAAGRPDERGRLLDAIRWVESRHHPDPPDGDDGRAIGPYQIHRVYWQDAIDFDPSIVGTYEDCRQRDYAERVIDAYMRRYASAAWAAHDAETIARVHNGGPNGAARRSTERYWERVRAALESR